MRLKVSSAATAHNDFAPSAPPPGQLCPQRVVLALLAPDLREAQVSNLRLVYNSVSTGAPTAVLAAAAAPGPGSLMRTSTAPAAVSGITKAPAGDTGAATSSPYATLARQLSRQMTLAPWELEDGPTGSDDDVTAWVRTAPLAFLAAGQNAAVASFAVPLSLTGTAEGTPADVRKELREWDFSGEGRSCSSKMPGPLATRCHFLFLA
jgi:hypothetical protein